MWTLSWPCHIPLAFLGALRYTRGEGPEVGHRTAPGCSPLRRASKRYRHGCHPGALTVAAALGADVALGRSILLRDSALMAILSGALASAALAKGR